MAQKVHKVKVLKLGQGFKAWSMYRKPCTIIDFAFYKKWKGHLNLVLATGERQFEQANLPKWCTDRHQSSF